MTNVTRPSFETWQTPQCPFRIEWEPAVLEEIRAAAMDAFFSLPHGGAEIGGVLMGTRKGGCVRIRAARPLECEHALGPSFTLSPNDHSRLAALLQEGEPVGWYHSHTRSEILLSSRDVEIHNRYFPDPWHVALVLRPHAMRPMRAGFFFRGPDGSIHAEASYREFQLLPAKAKSSPDPPETSPSPEPVRQDPGPAVIPPAKRSRPWLLWVAIVAGMAVGLAGLEIDRIRAFAAGRAPSVSLMAYDLDGQLQIRWDWSADPIRSAQSGTLEITDGAAHSVVALEPQRLRGGTISYVRTGARVDVHLTLREPGGRDHQEFITFLGRAVGRDTRNQTDGAPAHP